MEQNYIIITPLPLLTSEQRCIDLSIQIYKISRPLDDPEQITQYQFGWLVNPNGIDYALIVDLDAMIPVSPDKNLADLIALLGDNIPPEEIAQIVATINNQNPVRFGDIVPVEVSIRDEQYMIDNGWLIPHPLQ
jgi:hypothetical protein